MQVIVDKHTVTINKNEIINEGEYNVQACNFQFSSEYDGLPKIAIFKTDTVTKQILLSGDSCITPSEVLETTGIVGLGVYAYENDGDNLILRYSPTPAVFTVEPGSYDEGDTPTPPTPSIVEQLQAQITENANNISSLQDVTSTHTSQISSLETDANNIKAEQITQNQNIQTNADNIQTNKTDITNIKSEQITQNQNISQNTNDISDIKSEQVTQNNNIQNNTNDITTLQNDLSSEITNRQNADINLQSQIDAITSSSDVVDIVGTYAQLQSYDTQHLKNNDVIKVLQDETHDNAMTYYRWIKNTSTWQYIGQEGPYYTKSEVDTTLQDYVTDDDLNSALTDYVKNTDYATSSKGGVFRTANNVALNNGGGILCNSMTYQNYLNTDDWKFISKGTLENVIAGKQLINQTTLDESQAEQDANIEENASNIEELQSIVDQLPHEEGEGTDIRLEPTIEAKMSICEFGNSSQFSTDGKNLKDFYNINYEEYNATVTKNENEITVVGGALSYASCHYTQNTLQLEPNKTYTFSAKIKSTTNASGSLVYISGAISAGGSQIWGNQVGAGNKSYATFTTPETFGTNAFIGLYTGGTNNTAVFTDIQLEQGSTATSYEPYTGGIAAPSPDYPYPVKSVTGENSIVVQNENLFDGVYYNTYTAGSSPYPYSDNASGTRSGIIKVQPNTTYTILKGTSNRFRMSEYEEYPVVGSSYAIKYIFPSGADAFTNYTLTTGDTTHYLVIQVTNESQENVPMTVVKGTTVPTEQIPHEEQNYQLSLGNIELNSSPDGTIRDAIIGSPNNWFKREYIGKTVLDGSENWSRSGNTSATNFVGVLVGANMTRIIQCKVGERTQTKCTHFSITASLSDTVGYNLYNQTDNIYSAFALSMDISDIPDISAFKAYLQQQYTNGNPVTLYYPLVTPTDIPITDTTLINQLNDIYNNAHSYKGTTNITSTYEDGNEQMYLDASALTDIAKKIDTLTNAIIELGGE